MNWLNGAGEKGMIPKAKNEDTQHLCAIYQSFTTGIDK